MERYLTPRQREDWNTAVFGKMPVSLPDWRLSTAAFASGTLNFLHAKRASRALYLKMCRADLNTPELFTDKNHVWEILNAWDNIRELHNKVGPPRKDATTKEKRADQSLPVSGRFADIASSKEVRPRAMSRTEVQGVLQKNKKRQPRLQKVKKSQPQEPVSASISNKAVFTAAVRRDFALFNRLSPRLALPLPSKHEITVVIPSEGMDIRDLMFHFAPRLSIKTIANFVERVTTIASVDPVSKKIQPVFMTLDQAEAIPKGKRRDFTMRAARYSRPTKQDVNLKYEAFRHEQMDGHFLDQARVVRVPGVQNRKRKMWTYSSLIADKRDMDEIMPFLEDAEKKRRQEGVAVTNQYIKEERRMKKQRMRKDSVTGFLQAAVEDDRMAE